MLRQEAEVVSPTADLSSGGSAGGGGGGGVQGVRPPPFGPRCRLFNIGSPKVGPPLFLLVDLRWTPVADPGCVCV